MQLIEGRIATTLGTEVNALSRRTIGCGCAPGPTT
jgi:hypothetical protein